MEIPKVVAFMATTPWIWIMAKFLIGGDVYEVIPLTIFGYLLVLLHRASQEHQVGDEKNRQQDAFSQTDVPKTDEKETQTEQETTESLSQTSNECKEISTQTVVNKVDASSQEERKECEEKSTQTASEIMVNKEVETLHQGHKHKDTQTPLTLCLDKGVQIDNTQIPCKVFVPMKKGKPKPSIPPTKEFLKHHQNRHTLQRRKIKFKPRLEKIYEVDENESEPKLCKVMSGEELRSPVRPVQSTNAAKSSGEKSPLDVGTTCNDATNIIADDGTEAIKEKKASYFKKKFRNIKRIFKK